MNLEEFSNLVTHSNKESEMCKYFDQHLTLYSLLEDKFADILIDLKEDTQGCYYILRAAKEADIKHMESFYNNIRVDFFSHQFIVESTIHRSNIHIRFIDKSIAN